MSKRKDPPQRRYGGLDLSNVPYQEPILKNQVPMLYSDNTRKRPVGPGASKYMGIYQEKSSKLWRAQIMIDGRVKNLGSYSQEEDAARVYAKAAFFVKQTRPSDGIYGGFDLRGVPNQPLIITGVDKETGAVKYTNVKRCRQKWQASVTYQRRRILLGTFVTPEEAAAVHSKAAYFITQQQQQKQQPKLQQPQQRQPPLEVHSDQSSPRTGWTRAKADHGRVMARPIKAGRAPPAELSPRTLKRARRFLKGIDYAEV